MYDRLVEHPLHDLDYVKQPQQTQAGVDFDAVADDAKPQQRQQRDSDLNAVVDHKSLHPLPW